MIKVSKTKVDDTYSVATGDHHKINPARYINLSGFKDDIEHDIIFRKIELMLKEWGTRSKVF